MSTQQRRDVFAGKRAKTSGGLTKKDLIQNKRGKIVSRKKSGQAGSQNNLGSWLREKGKTIEKAAMLRKKTAPPADAPIRKKKKPKKASKAGAQQAKPKVAPPAKAVPKVAAQKAAAPKKKAAVPRKKPEAKPKKKKLKTKPGINPLTQQPYDKKSASGYVEKAAVSLDNVKLKKRGRGKKGHGLIDTGAYTGGW